MVTLDVELQVGAKRRGGTLYYFDEPFESILQDSGMERRDVTASPSPGAT